MSWQWRMMQNLKRNRLVVSKLKWEIWQILTRAFENLKNFHFNGLLLSKVDNVLTKKVQRSYGWYHWRLFMQNLKENWLVLLKTKWGIWQIFAGWKIAISYILENKMVELNQNKNSEQPDPPYAVWKICFILKTNE